jgi:uncharacterized protein (DUF1501 family)/uncharacterized protein (DUF1800 family)
MARRRAAAGWWCLVALLACAASAWAEAAAGEASSPAACRAGELDEGAFRACDCARRWAAVSGAWARREELCGWCAAVGPAPRAEGVPHVGAARALAACRCCEEWGGAGAGGQQAEAGVGAGAGAGASRRALKRPKAPKSKKPTKLPTALPTRAPIAPKTKRPTRAPTPRPTTRSPTARPSRQPTLLPSARPSAAPSAAPSAPPSAAPSVAPSAAPTTPPPTLEPAAAVSCPEPGAGVALDGGRIYPFRDSAAGQLCTLSLVHADGTRRPLARAYDSGAWEASAPLSSASQLSFSDCAQGVCRAFVPLPYDNATLQISPPMLLVEGFRYSSPSAQAAAARLLSQGTFGPNAAAVAALSGGSAAAWVAAELAKRASLHRAYYRERTNPRLSASGPPYGRPRGACEAGSRWRSYALSTDDVGKTLTVSGSAVPLLLLLDGAPLTELAVWPLSDALAPFVVCSVIDGPGAAVTLGRGCKGTLVNPTVAFASGLVPDGLVSGSRLALLELSPPVPGAALLQGSPPGDCAAGALSALAFARRASDGSYWIADPRLATLENTPEAPAAVNGLAGGAACPNVPKTFLNAASCVAGVSSCAPTRFAPALFTLDAGSVRAFYELDGRFVYSIEGLRTDDVGSPCRAWSRSRWLLLNAGACASPDNGKVAAGANATLTKMLAQSSDPNPLVRDIKMAEQVCSPAAATVGAKLTVTMPGGAAACWQHVHPSLYSVFDFSDWSTARGHQGNAEALKAGRPNPITRPALSGATVLAFPSWHPMARWDGNTYQYALVGRLGDVVDFATLSRALQSPAMAQRVGSVALAPGAVGEACGSPGEVTNVASRGDRLTAGLSAYAATSTLDSALYFKNSKTATWMALALGAPDQLRQRVAWALSQIFVVSADLVASDDYTEWFLHYYDIFVRNAFGSYLQILKEVAFSPLMADMLSYRNSKSLAFTLVNDGRTVYPDENFAREILQLFSVGLWRLNADGTPAVDAATGDRVPAYDIADITVGARAWTGFRLQDPRGNYESPSGRYTENLIDPLDVVPEWRDAYPKPDLLGGYFGDHYPLCAELPARHFLRQGAEWRFLGTSTEPQLTQRGAWDEGFGSRVRLVLDPAGGLFDELCNAATPGGKCRHRSVLTLSRDVSCTSQECAVDTLKVVGVPVAANPCAAFPGLIYSENLDDPNADGGVVQGDVCVTPGDESSPFACPAGCVNATGPDAAAKKCVFAEPAQDGLQVACKLHSAHVIYYEYVKPACTHQPFFANGKKIRLAYEASAMCEDPRLTVAAGSCCRWGGSYAGCAYQGEAVTYATAQQRCAADPSGGTFGCDNFQWFSEQCSQWPMPPYHWTVTTCAPQVKVGKDGRVAVVHKPTSGGGTVLAQYQQGNLNWFKALWEGGVAPPADTAADCAAAGCSALPDGCLCSASVQESAVFAGGAGLPTHADALLRLRVGSAAPAAFDAGTFSLMAQRGPDGVKVYTRRSSAGVDASTVFEVVTPTGRTVFLRNVYSRVSVGSSGRAFRNPPQFMSVATPEKRDALFETDAVLTHIAEHPNTAPFMATRLIQHLVTSNPSPRYVARVARAFTEGAFQGLGSGKYGDLGAAVAAVLLDREARSATLDTDRAFGKLREPLLKIVHFMRATEFAAKPGREVELPDLVTKIGEMAHHARTVFSFFTPDYAPQGAAENARLVAPEAQLMTSPWSIALLNGMFSMARFGLHECDNGFGQVYVSYSCWRMLSGQDSAVPTSAGDLAWTPSAGPSATAAQIVSELDLLLTAGRLSDAARAVIQAEVQAATSAKKLKVAYQLFLASAEFAATNLARPSGAERPRDSTGGGGGGQPYKAAIMLFLKGGADSYNFVVPHSGCNGGADVYARYASARGDIALGKDSLLQVSAGGQACSTYGLHPSLVNMAAMYRAGDAAIVANVGTLLEPVTKAALEDGSAVLPDSLYAHNVQDRGTQTLEPGKRTSGTGAIGRINDALTRLGHSCGSYSLVGGEIALTGKPGGAAAPPQMIDPWDGVNPFDENPLSSRILPAIRQLTQNSAGSVFAETWAKHLNSSIDNAARLGAVLSGVSLKTPFNAADNYIAMQLKQVARLIQAAPQLGHTRDTFFVALGGWDTHSDELADMTRGLTDLDNALALFKNEMQKQGLWDSVVIVQASEFGRTLSSNGGGTDHAWAGNAFVLGGKVKGGSIKGSFISDYSDAGPQAMGRGRLIPSLSWDHVWHATAQFLGVSGAALGDVVPNRAAFPDMWNKDNLFN